MASSRLLLLLLVGVLIATAAAPATAVIATAAASATAVRCFPSSIAEQVNRHCCSETNPPPSACCDAVKIAMDAGNDAMTATCLCRLDDYMYFIVTGLSVGDLVGMYTACGGHRPGDAHRLAASCLEREMSLRQRQEAAAASRQFDITCTKLVKRLKTSVRVP